MPSVREQALVKLESERNLVNDQRLWSLLVDALDRKISKMDRSALADLAFDLARDEMESRFDRLSEDEFDDWAVEFIGAYNLLEART